MQDNVKYLISDNAIIYSHFELRIVATAIKLSTAWYKLLLKRTVGWHECANIIYMQAECQDKSTKCIFKRNLNPILIFHGSFPNVYSLLLFLSLLVSLGVVLLQRNLPLYFSLSFPSIVHSRRLSPHHLISVSLFLPPLFPSRGSFPSGSGRATSSSLL